MADKFLSQWCTSQYPDRDLVTNPITFEELSKDYWSIVETGSRQAAVDYGNDIEIANYRSGFPIDNVAKNSYLFETVNIYLKLYMHM